MPPKKLTLLQEDALERKRFKVTAHYLIEWINQLTYLIFFVVLLSIFSMLMTFLLLLSQNAVLTQTQTGWLYAGTMASIFLGIVLIIAVQYKRTRFEQRIRTEIQ